MSNQENNQEQIQFPAQQELKPITARDLAVTEAAETYLFSLGFTDFRVRLAGRSAKIQLPAAQMPHLLEHRQEILDRLGQDYDAVWLDLEARA